MILLTDTQVFIIPGYPIILEIFIIAVIVALLGAIGYTFFVSSMSDDAADNARKRMNNPWEKMNVKSSIDDTPDRPKLTKSIIIRLIILSVSILVMVLLLVALMKGWIVL